MSIIGTCWISIYVGSVLEITRFYVRWSDMEKAQEIGPYATSHQETINEAWDKYLAKYR